MWKTHIMLGAIAGYAAYPSWKGAAVGAAMALVPDVDKAGSKAGRMVWPLSWMVEKGLGHRTVTHSWVMLFIPALLFGDTLMAKAALWGLCSHLISDAVVGRIQFLWPLPKGWIGVRSSRYVYQAMDKLVFFGAIGYIVYRFYTGE